ncbi:MAG: DUF4143 domain-containing protein [Propionibacteriaceae bacterium]|nr:DUF4143 domain-containing protein [Propionibacteriaceae bacterium]
MLEELVAGLPAVVLEGARGVGKTASAQRLATTCLSLDLDTVREALVNQPTRLDSLPAPVLLDEWQAWPQVWDLVRHRVDDGAAPGAYLLTGSAAPLQANIHSGAGRMVRLRMRPYSLAERRLDRPTVSLGSLLSGSAVVEGDTPVTFANYVSDLAASGFPGVRALPPRLRRRQLTSYLDSIVARDFALQGLPVRQPQTLRRWLRAYAAATATGASYSEILDASSAGDSDKPAKTTTIAYREVLDSLWLLDEVGPWIEGEDFFARLKQSPKHFLADPALAMVLLGLDEADLIAGRSVSPLDRRFGSIAGRLFEALVAVSLLTYAVADDASVSHLRTRNGDHEVDFIVQRGSNIVAIEVKLAPTVTDSDLRHLHWLRDRLNGRLTEAVVVTTGAQAYRRTQDGIAVVPAALLGP